jgi:hypothetical protein
MKITAQEVAALAAIIAPYDTEAAREDYRNGRFARADKVQDLNKRYRWDLVGASGWQTTADLYDAGYTHIDTALRSIVPAL